MKKGLKIKMVNPHGGRFFHLLFTGSFLHGKKSNCCREERYFNGKFSNHTNPGNKIDWPPVNYGGAKRSKKRSGGQIKVRMYWTDELKWPQRDVDLPVQKPPRRGGRE